MNKFTEQEIDLLRRTFALVAEFPLEPCQTKELDALMARCSTEALTQLSSADIPHVSQFAHEAWKIKAQQVIRELSRPVVENLTQTASRELLDASGDEGVLL